MSESLNGKIKVSYEKDISAAKELDLVQVEFFENSFLLRQNQEADRPVYMILNYNVLEELIKAYEEFKVIRAKYDRL